MQITFKSPQMGNIVVRLVWSTYRSNNRSALELVDPRTGEPFTTATVNLPGVQLADDEIILKDYSENEGMLRSLVDAGVVQDMGRRERTGFVTCPVVRVLRRDPA
jgi:hypothetical protein